MRADPAVEWARIGVWLLMLSGIPALGFAVWFVMQRLWVSCFGKPAVATVLTAERVATLPRIITEVMLEFRLPDEPEYVRIRARMRWNERTMMPDQLTPGSRHAVRYHITDRYLVMPDARSR